MNTQEIFTEFFARGLTSSRRGWSRAWLAKAPNYATENRDQELPPEAAIKLYQNLKYWSQRDPSVGDLIERLRESILAYEPPYRMPSTRR